MQYPNGTMISQPSIRPLEPPTPSLSINLFEAKNRQRIGVRQDSSSMLQAHDYEYNSNTAPSPMEYSAQRLVWDNDSGKTHFVLDDPATDNGTLEDHCASPAFECLEFSLTVADDGNWDNVSSIEPRQSFRDLHDRAVFGSDPEPGSGRPENRGSFHGLSRIYKHHIWLN